MAKNLKDTKLEGKLAADLSHLGPLPKPRSDWTGSDRIGLTKPGSDQTGLTKPGSDRTGLTKPGLGRILLKKLISTH